MDGYYGDGQSHSVEQNDQSNGEAHHSQQGPAVGNPAVHCGACQGSREVNHFTFLLFLRYALMRKCCLAKRGVLRLLRSSELPTAFWVLFQPTGLISGGGVYPKNHSEIMKWKLRWWKPTILTDRKWGTHVLSQSRRWLGFEKKRFVFINTEIITPFTPKFKK